MLTFGHQTRSDRLRPIHGAVVIVLIHTPDKVGVVVEDIIAGMRHDETKDQREPGQEAERTIPPGKQTRQGSRNKSHDKNGSPGGDEPFGYDIQSIPFFL